VPVFENTGVPYDAALETYLRDECEGVCTITFDPTDVADRDPPLCVDRFQYEAPPTEAELTKVTVVFVACEDSVPLAEPAPLGE
jgi:hypothetical protein